MSDHINESFLEPGRRFSPFRPHGDGAVGELPYGRVSSALYPRASILTGKTESVLHNVSPPEPVYFKVDLSELLESWKQKTRDLWFRRNGICAPPNESGFDNLIPELQAADDVQTRFRDVHSKGAFGEITHNSGSALRLISVDGLAHESNHGVDDHLYKAFDKGRAVELGPPSGQPPKFVAQGSPTRIEANNYSSAPATLLADRLKTTRRPAISISGKLEPAAQVLAVTTSEIGNPQALTLLRNKSPPSDWGETYRGVIRVQRPAGVKWDEPTRCTYISPITGDKCYTKVKRGPDLERHLRTVHLRQEAQAVSDGLIHRRAAKLLPSEWQVGDRLDFDCPYCSVRFTRDDARNRHVKMKH